MYGGIRIGDIVTYKEDSGSERLYLVTSINDRNFNAAGNWAFYLTLKGVGGGGGFFDVASDNVSVIMTAKWYDQMRSTL